MNGVNSHEMKTVHIMFHFCLIVIELVKNWFQLSEWTDKNSRLAPPSGVTQCRKSESPQCCRQGNQIHYLSYFQY